MTPFPSIDDQQSQPQIRRLALFFVRFWFFVVKNARKNVKTELYKALIINYI